MTRTYDCMFDLSDSQGANESERSLIALCATSFLSLWSFPNTYTSEGAHANHMSGKEFADVLVVFGRDVLIFSDKHVELDATADLRVAWSRWHRKAVFKSIRQLRGARNWLTRFPDQIFLDAACTRQLPVAMPAADDRRIHLIATTRGTAQACRAHFDAPTGSLIVNSGIDIGDANQPFSVGVTKAAGQMVHVFDEDALRFVMEKLDTAPDFIEYLLAREAFLRDEGHTVVCAGEEVLLALYLGGSLNRDALVGCSRKEVVHDILSLEWGIADEFFDSEAYRSKVQADRSSYAWDEQIEEFIRLGDPRYGKYEAVPVGSVEHALRIMASEPRFRRRILVNMFNEMLAHAAPRPDMARTRISQVQDDPERAYVFACFPCHAQWDQDEYRLRRRNFLASYVAAAPLRLPTARTIVGLAVDHPVRSYPGKSEDLVVILTQPLTEEDRAALRANADRLSIYREHAAMRYAQIAEYPAASTHGGQEPSRQQRRAIERQRAKKSRPTRDS